MGKSALAKKLEALTPKPLTPTEAQYISLQEAYDFFNHRLFKGELPPVLITLQRQKKSHGYYWHEKFENRKEAAKISEIALNVADFATRKDKDIFSTLLHEMVHHWQSCFGKDSRNGYHNKEWGIKMKEVGLYPSSTAQPGGKETGQKVSHYVIEGGLFDIVCSEMMERGIAIDWQSIETAEEKAKSKKANKIKYTCPMCQANAWGKPDLHIACGDCSTEEEMVRMIAEESEGEEA